MTNKISYCLIIFLLLCAGCSGTEFPNPGSSDNDDKVATAESEVIAAAETSALPEQFDVEGNLLLSHNSRFYQSIFNECVQVLTPTGPPGQLASFVQTETENTSSAQQPSISSFIGTVPLSFTANQMEEDNNSIALVISEEERTINIIKFKQDGEFIGHFLSQESTANNSELEPISIENCQQSLDTQEVLLLNGSSTVVQHQQWSYQASELQQNGTQSDVSIVIDIYQDNQGTGLQKTLQFGLTFYEGQEIISSGEAEGSSQTKTYLFQPQQNSTE
ncbi:MAG: hypothetical protein HQM14_21635 [SAR324 cluster bacterium]|nr:hypothetical protein [SAR324 cluster bacterium]